MTRIRRKLSTAALLAITLTILFALITAQPTDDDPSSEDPNANTHPSHPTNAPPTRHDASLNSNSVILITGAAGFIGSELALALKRTYHPKKLLLVDNLGIESDNESMYVPPSKKDDGDNKNKKIYQLLDEETLSLFEIRRQRLFRIFHEVTSPLLEDDPSSSSSQQHSTLVKFYRADMRPSIPEFFDFGEVPLLEGIFASHPDITHVVHLADVHDTNMAIPRRKDSVKAGLMEGILEELKMVRERAREGVTTAGNSGSGDANANSADSNTNGGIFMPQFVYASTSEVYDSLPPTNPSNPPPFREHLPITTPSTLLGASKLMQEILASAFHSTHGISSVGMRLFEVYGPWSTPGSEVFDLIEGMAVERRPRENSSTGEDIKDYVFIDDAVDAIMAAMQYKSAKGVPAVFNVGTGRGSTLKMLEEEVGKVFPNVERSDAVASRQSTTSVAHTARSQALLGFKAQTSLEEGLAHTISWHLDRSLPYDHDPSAAPSLERQSFETAVSAALDQRRPKCSPLDRECLRGSPVFPCASECRRSERCTPSAWDDVAALSRVVTSGCDAVLYTILLEEDVEQIPSATTAVGVDSSPFVGAGLPNDLGKRTAARCNLAFVSESSPLYKKLKSDGETYVDEEDTASELPALLRHGFWTVLPVRTSKKNSEAWLHAFSGRYSLEYLPKLSPGMFFGSSVRFAAYADPTVVVDNLPKLFKIVEGGYPSSGLNRGSTALLLSTNRPKCDPSVRGSTCQWTRPPKNDSLQASVYNTIRVALRGQLLGGSLDPTVDTSFVIHVLNREDARLFRCDTYTEVAQWGAAGDERAVEFMVSLHDMWSKAVMHWSGQDAWWVDTGEKSDEKENKEATEESEVYDKGTYMGILSSSENQLFTHIIPSEGFGIIHLKD